MAALAVYLVLGLPFYSFIALKCLNHESVTVKPIDGTPYQPAEQQKPDGVVTPDATAAKLVPDEQTPWYRDAESRTFTMLGRFAIFSAAALFGALGATLSYLRRQRLFTNPTVALSASHLALSLFVGALSAVVLTMVFAGGLIRGAIFPEGYSSTMSWFTVIYVHHEFAKLLVWAFIAGFSERVVPDVIEDFIIRLKKNTREPDAPTKA
jgi:hypothetical protein